MRYFFKLDENNIILDAKISSTSIAGWTEVDEVKYLTLINMLNNPNSLVNSQKGVPEYVHGNIGVIIPHPSTGIIPIPVTSKNGSLMTTVSNNNTNIEIFEIDQNLKRIILPN